MKILQKMKDTKDKQYDWERVDQHNMNIEYGKRIFDRIVSYSSILELTPNERVLYDLYIDHFVSKVFSVMDVESDTDVIHEKVLELV